MAEHTAGERVSVIERTRRNKGEPFGVELICNTRGAPCSITIARDCTEDDAHRLVKCWNSHDALVGALEFCAMQLEDKLEDLTDEAALEQAKQALSQAKGE